MVMVMVMAMMVMMMTPMAMRVMVLAQRSLASAPLRENRHSLAEVPPDGQKVEAPDMIKLNTQVDVKSLEKFLPGHIPP